MTFKYSAFALPLLAAATMGTAQEINHLSYGAGYTTLSSGEVDIDILSLGGNIDYTNNGFVFNGGLGYIDVDGEVDVTSVGFRAGYQFTPEIAAYLGMDQVSADGNDLTAYNIGAEYSTGQFTLGLNIDQVDIDGLDPVPTVYGSYAVSPDLELALFVSDVDGDISTAFGADYDTDGTKISAFYSTVDGYGIFAFDGVYDFGNGFRAGGGYANFDGEADILAVRGGYEVAENFWVDLSIGQMDLGGDETVDTIGLSVSFETGRETLLIDRGENAQARALGPIGQLVSLGF